MIRSLFSTYIYAQENFLNEEEYNKVVNECDNLKDVALEKSKWICDVDTSFFKPEFDLKNNKNFEVLIKNIEHHIFLFCNNLQSFPEKVKVNEAWFNLSNKGQYQEQHTHAGHNISAIYYVKAPEGSAGTVFKQPYFKQSLPKLSNHKFIQESAIYRAKPNTLILFESHVPHLTEQHKIDQERITIAMNFLVC